MTRVVFMKYGNLGKGRFGLRRFDRMNGVLMAVGLMTAIMAGGCIEEGRQESLNFGTSAYLTIDKAPALNQTAELTLTISAVRNFSNITAKIILPEGLELVSGNLVWHGALIENKTQSIHAKVKAVKIGTWTIDGAVTGASDQIYLSIQENEGRITERPLQNFTRGKKYVEAK